MNNKKIINALYRNLDQLNYKGKVVSINHARELIDDIKKTHQNGSFDKDLHRSELSHFNYSIFEKFTTAKSLIVVAIPQPHIHVTFHPNGVPFLCVIPSNYSHKTDEYAKNIIESHLKPEGYHFEKAHLPLKSLAVHSGLAEYGRNNISYVKGMGSFFRLVAFVSNLPCFEDNWAEFKILERCETCTLCQKMCPTGAIPSDRFLLRAERCLSFFSEWPGKFPDWLDPSWHHCLVGCLMCQNTCPINRDFANNIEKSVAFSAVETELILKETPEDRLPQETLEKLERLDIAEYIGLLGRNLQVLIDNSLDYYRILKNTD